ncbi:hybrid sensor histidine kinase/response regulator [bacterium]|nr:hybrid sensor histidine kinase/response regulator [bacterium]
MIEISLMLITVEMSFYGSIFFLFFALHHRAFKDILGFIGFGLIALVLLQRFLYPDILPIVSQFLPLLACLFILVALLGKNSLGQNLSDNQSTKMNANVSEIFESLKKKQELPLLIGLSGLGISFNPSQINLFSFLLILAAGILLYTRSNTKQLNLLRWFSHIFIVISLGELFFMISPDHTMMKNVSFISYLAAFIVLIVMLRNRTSLNFRIRYFLTGLTLTYITLAISSILFLAVLNFENKLETMELQSITLGTLAIMLFMSVICWFIAQTFSRPLQKLIDYSKSLKEGNLEPLPVTLNTFEYDEILEGLNLMVRAIRRNREDLESQISQLKELDKLREEFLANVSHEFRTPLTMIIGNTELILAGLIGEISEEQREFLQPVYDEAHKLLQLITDVLNFSKIERGESELFLENVNLKEVSRQVIAEFMPLARLRKIMIYNEVPELTIAVDAVKFRQIIVHLISNALKFNGKEGKVRIKARVKPKEADDQENMLEIQVADTGIGIRPELLDNIFDKFRQGDGSATREYGGTGIGLTIVKSFTELHGGQVEVKSVVGKGTQFAITIPHRVLDTEEQMEQPVEQAVTATVKDNILLVLIEPDQHISKLLKTYLVQDGYNVLAISSGREALEQIQRLKPSLICLNPVLSDINGWELLKKLKGQPETSTIPVIIVTVLEKRKLAKKCGADDYIILPVRKNKFVETIVKTLSGSQAPLTND